MPDTLISPEHSHLSVLVLVLPHGSKLGAVREDEDQDASSGERHPCTVQCYSFVLAEEFIAAHRPSRTRKMLEILGGKQIEISKMHRNKKAWFSQSVSRHICDIWVTEGGIITNWRSADFLFSNDAAHPDTQRIFESLEFVEDKATVFHASYLSACEESGLKGSVAMGHFLLPPSFLHEEIRAAIGSFIWEQQSPLPPQQPHERGTISKRKTLEISHSPEMERMDQAVFDVPNNACSDQNLVIETASFEAATCHVQQMYPVNNMVTGFISIDELKKYSGNLYDFIPGCVRYSVCRVQRERNMFSVLKCKNRNRTFIHTN